MVIAVCKTNEISVFDRLKVGMRFHFTYCEMLDGIGIIVLTHFSGGGGGGGGGEGGTQMGFLFSQFWFWPIDIFIVESCEWYH